MKISNHIGTLAHGLSLRGFVQTEDAAGSATFVCDEKSMHVNVSVSEGEDFAELTVQKTGSWGTPTMERRVQYASRDELELYARADACRVVDENAVVNM